MLAFIPSCFMFAYVKNISKHINDGKKLYVYSLSKIGVSFVKNAFLLKNLNGKFKSIFGDVVFVEKTDVSSLVNEDTPIIYIESLFKKDSTFKKIFYEKY